MKRCGLGQWLLWVAALLWLDMRSSAQLHPPPLTCLPPQLPPTSHRQIMEAEHAAGQPSQLVATVGLDVKEELSCGACGRTTHQTQYVQYFHNAQVGLWSTCEVFECAGGLYLHCCAGTCLPPPTPHPTLPP